MTRTKGRQESQVRPRRRLAIGVAGILLLLVFLIGCYELADDGVSAFYDSLGSVLLSKALVQPENQAQDALLDRAGALFQKALRWNPENGRAYYNLGRIYLARNQQSAALSAFERVVDIDPHEPYANHQLGFLYDELGDDDAALEAWQESTNAPMLVREGLLCRGQGRAECAERFYKLALSVDATYADAYYYLALLYEAQGRDADAIEAFTGALDSPFLQMRKRYIAEARIHAYAERWEEAIGAYEQAVEEDPTSADAYLQIGSILIRQLRDESAAIEWFLAAVEADPHNTAPYLRLANLYWAREDCVQAADWYERAAAAAHEEPEALARAQMGLTRCAQLEGDLQGALRAAQGAVDAQPDEAAYHVLLADVYAEMQRTQEAIASYRHALALEPDNRRARRQLSALGWQEP